LIEVRTVVDEDMAFSGYIVTQEGEHWLLQNQDSLSLKYGESSTDDIPF
jgi:hypothetical protein